MVESFDGLQPTIWTGEGEPAIGRNKADAHRDRGIVSCNNLRKLRRRENQRKAQLISWRVAAINSLQQGKLQENQRWVRNKTRPTSHPCLLKLALASQNSAKTMIPSTSASPRGVNERRLPVLSTWTSGSIEMAQILPCRWTTANLISNSIVLSHLE